MRIFALSDPHLAHGTPGKTMDRFGPQWVDHPVRMAREWDARVDAEDLVLVPGDISWARTAEQVRPDLEWLAARPGTKVLLTGNHDHWWGSRAKVRALLPASVLAVDGDALRVGDVAVCGTRLWESADMARAWHGFIRWSGEPISPEPTEEQARAAEKVFAREVARLERALLALDAPDVRGAATRVAMVHYPPASPDLLPNALTALFEQARIDHVVFGHLHAVDPARRADIADERNGVRYHLASCDWIDFTPLLVAG